MALIQPEHNDTVTIQYRLHQFRTEAEMRGIVGATRNFLLALSKKILTPKTVDFDKRYGTVTQDVVEVVDGELPPEAFDTAVRYVPTSPVVILHICRKLRIDHRDFVFLDMGSGRGRALLLASDFPFAKIIGVEISPLHARIAQENISIYKSPRQRCRDISAICQNVTEYVPPSRNLVVYMYQPFAGPVLRVVLAHLKEAAGDQHTVFLCFSAPYYMQDVILKDEYFRRIEHFPTFGDSDDAWTLYGNAKAVALYTR